MCATSKDDILPPALSAYSCPKDHECIEIRDTSTEDILIAPRRLQASDVAVSYAHLAVTLPQGHTGADTPG